MSRSISSGFDGQELLRSSATILIRMLRCPLQSLLTVKQNAGVVHLDRRLCIFLGHWSRRIYDIMSAGMRTKPTGADGGLMSYGPDTHEPSRGICRPHS